MLNFNFYNPTKIIFGQGEISKLKDELPKDKKILITYGGGSIKKNGIYDQVVKALDGYQFLEFSGIEPNPTLQTLLKALKIIKEEKIDFLLAVGGGSVIDGTKFLSSAALYEGDDPWEILSKGIRTYKGLPFGTVLTLPATGSEMNSGAVITNKDTKEKLGMGGPGLFPQFSILDPTVISSLPERQIQNGIIDAFVHVLEQYATYDVGGMLQDRFAESIMSTLIEVGPKVLEDKTNYKFASNFMWSCTMALNGLIQKGVVSDWSVHGIGHELTAFYGIDHARTLAIICPSLYRYKIENKKEKLAQLGRRVFNLSGNDVNQLALETIKSIENFFQSLGVDTKLSKYTDEYSNAAELISTRFKERGWLGIGEKKDITPDDVFKIVEMSY